MQVVLFGKALLAFSLENTAIFSGNRPEKPKNKGQTTVVRPFAIANIRNFPAESKLC